MSNETRFTPGPWTISPKDEGSGYGIDGGEGEPVVWWAAEDEPMNGIEKEEDARLIAAAPDLYAALEAIASADNKKWPEHKMASDLRSLVDDALAKARGEA